MIHEVDKRLAGPACCVPTEMTNLDMLYLDANKRVTLHSYDDMTVTACGCR